MSTKIYYRVVTPPAFSDLDRSTLEEAQSALVAFGNVEKEGSPHTEYWQAQRAKCKIFKVVEIAEEVDPRVDVRGVIGSEPWQREFKSLKSACKWAELHDAKILSVKALRGE